MPTTISATINPLLYNSPLHGLQGPAYGPPGSAKQTLLGLRVIQADSLSTVYWWLAVIVKKSISIQDNSDESGVLFDKGWEDQDHSQCAVQQGTITFKVCHEKNFSNSGADISVSMHFTENLKVPAERPWKMQTFDTLCIFVGQIVLGLHQSN